MTPGIGMRAQGRVGCGASLQSAHLWSMLPPAAIVPCFDARLGLTFASKLFQRIETPTFSVAAIRAQMAARRFWANTSVEFKLMLALAAASDAGRGPLS